MLVSGFDGTTIDAIAGEAGVSVQTVYAVFGSKKGIVAELMDRARFGEAYREAVTQAKETSDPSDRLRGVARITRQVYAAERAEIELLRGVGAVSPELASLEREKEAQRFEAQARNADVLASSGRLRPGITSSAARDIVWTLTGRDTFRMLVVERGWALSRYEEWLGDTLVRALLTDRPPARRRRR
jgi:AcrR family transcriptional regulator